MNYSLTQNQQQLEEQEGQEEQKEQKEEVRVSDFFTYSTIRIDNNKKKNKRWE